MHLDHAHSDAVLTGDFIEVKSHSLSIATFNTEPMEILFKLGMYFSFSTRPINYHCNSGPARAILLSSHCECQSPALCRELSLVRKQPLATWLLAWKAIPGVSSWINKIHGTRFLSPVRSQVTSLRHCSHFGTGQRMFFGVHTLLAKVP